MLCGEPSVSSRSRPGQERPTGPSGTRKKHVPGSVHLKNNLHEIELMKNDEKATALKQKQEDEKLQVREGRKVRKRGCLTTYVRSKRDEVKPSRTQTWPFTMGFATRLVRDTLALLLTKRRGRDQPLKISLLLFLRLHFLCYGFISFVLDKERYFLAPFHMFFMLTEAYGVIHGQRFMLFLAVSCHSWRFCHSEAPLSLCLLRLHGNRSIFRSFGAGRGHMERFLMIFVLSREETWD